MRYRQLDENGDYVFGPGTVFLINSPECVAQLVKTRLSLWTGQWFYDVTDGTDFEDDILGSGGTDGAADLEIQDRITSTQGVLEILSYGIVFNPATRTFSGPVQIDTIYGPTTVNT